MQALESKWDCIIFETIWCIFISQRSILQDFIGSNGINLQGKKLCFLLYISTLHKYILQICIFRVVMMFCSFACPSMLQETALYEGNTAWIPWNLSFRYVHYAGQFTPKTKANAESHLLSSLVWIDQCNECIGMTSFMEFILFIPSHWSPTKQALMTRNMTFHLLMSNSAMIINV